jgi:tRNA(Ile)-lysidine synthetase-like protein
MSPERIPSAPGEGEILTQRVPPGRWAVGVSGGADSVALLLLLRDQPDLFLHIVHLDHQTRGKASTDDAAFVADLAARLSHPCTLARRDQIEPLIQKLSRNPSARYRAIRMELFRRTVARENLDGVILAHQADDQAETILFRLLRGSGPAGLMGMSSRRRIDGLLILRPLLGLRRQALRDFLFDRRQPWREDPTNQSDRYARGRVRAFLQSRPELHEPLLELGRACAGLVRSVRQSAPVLKEEFPAVALAEFPTIVARESARRWLLARGVPPAELVPAVLDRLCQMASDAAAPPRQQFPHRLIVRRRSGWIGVVRD